MFSLLAMHNPNPYLCYISAGASSAAWSQLLTLCYRASLSSPSNIWNTNMENRETTVFLWLWKGKKNKTLTVTLFYSGMSHTVCRAKRWEKNQIIPVLMHTDEQEFTFDSVFFIPFLHKESDFFQLDTVPQQNSLHPSRLSVVVSLTLAQKLLDLFPVAPVPVYVEALEKQTKKSFIWSCLFLQCAAEK